MKGFTLLEVMISVAILAGVVLTVLTTVNHHLDVLARERNETTLTLLARAKLEELLQQNLGEKQEGTFADLPGVRWRVEKSPYEPLPGISIQKIVLKVDMAGKEEISLVHYLE